MSFLLQREEEERITSYSGRSESRIFRLQDIVESASKINNAWQNLFHHKTCLSAAHMLAFYLTAMQISHLLKPHAHFVNRMHNNVILLAS